MSNGGGRSHTAIQKEREQAMPDSGDMPHEVDFSKPNVARMYDYYHGGKDNYPADREAARRVLGAASDVPLAALENREFLKRATQFLVRDQGIRHFVDIAPGLPTQSNGFDLIEPGVVFLSQWRPAGEYYAQGGTRWGYCGLGKKP